MHDHISMLLERGAYRTSSIDSTDTERFTYGAPTHRALWWFASATLTIMLGALGAAPIGCARSELARDSLTLAVLAITFCAPACLALVGGIRSMIRARRAWRRETLSLDSDGIRVVGRSTPLFVPWSGVTAFIRDDRGTRLDTIAGPIEIEPGMDDPRGFHRAIEPHVSPSVLDSWRRAYGLAAIEVSPGVRRHLMRTASTEALSVLLAGVAATPLLAMVLAFALHDAPRPDAVTVTLDFVSAAFALLIWRVTTRSYIEVTDDRCVFQFASHRRAFAWADIVEVRLPTDTRPGLTLNFRSGARLWCPIGLFADSDRILDELRLRTSAPPLPR